MLPDYMIRDLIEEEDMVVNVDLSKQLQPASLDVRIKESVTLIPGEFALASTIEYVRIPASFVARLEGKSSLGRIGLLVHITAGFIDAGFYGNIVLELSNLSDKVIRLRSGDCVAQLCFMKLLGCPERLYGDCGNHYQGQEGITRSYLDVE